MSTLLNIQPRPSGGMAPGAASAIAALNRYATPMLLKAIEHPDVEVHYAAVQVCSACEDGMPVDLIPHVVAMLAKRPLPADIGDDAIDALSSRAATSSIAAEAVVRFAADATQHVELRKSALTSLCVNGCRRTRFTATTLDALSQDENVELAVPAARLRINMGPDEGAPSFPENDESLSELERRLANTDTRKSIRAAIAILNRHPIHERARQRVMFCITELEESDRKSCISQLGALRDPPTWVIDAIVAQFEEPTVRMNPKTEKAEYVDAEERILEVLRDFGPKAPSAAKVLVDRLETISPNRRAKLKKTIRSIDSRSLSALCEGLQHANPQTRWWCARLLGTFGQAARPAIPSLLKATSDRLSVVRWEVVYSLTRTRTLDAAVVNQLTILAASDEDEDVRSLAAKAVADLRRRK